MPLSAQNSTQVPPFRPELVIMVWSASPDKVRLALAYERNVPQSEVQTALKRLQQCSGWEIASDLRIVAGKALPKSKPSTAAEVSLFHAPQWVGDEPAILPYLTAFQNKSRVEVVFITGAPLMERAVDVAENSAYRIRRQVSATGMVRYEAEILEHRTPLPAMKFGQKLERVNPNGIAQSKASEMPVKPKEGSSSRLWILAIAGLVLIALGAYVFRMGNRSTTSI